MNIINNLIFNCNNCFANTAFVTIRESTAAAPPPPQQPFFSVNQAKWSFVWYKNLDRSEFYRFVTIHACDRQTDRQTDEGTEFSSLYRVCIPCSAVKIGDFAPTRSFWSKISGRRGRSLPIIFARIVRPMNALQFCSWQFSHKETL